MPALVVAGVAAVVVACCAFFAATTDSIDAPLPTPHAVPVAATRTRDDGWSPPATRTALDAAVGNASTDDASGRPALVSFTSGIDGAIGPLFGKVVGPYGEFVTGAWVTLRVVDARGIALEKSHFAECHPDGHFLIDALPRRAGSSASLVAEHPEFARGAELPLGSVARGGDRGFDLRLGDRRAEVVGRIVGEDGAAIWGASIVMDATSGAPRRWLARTEPDGRFRAPELPPGTYALTLERRCLAAGALAFVVDPMRPRTDLGTIATTESRCTLRLRVLDANRDPIAAAFVASGTESIGRTGPDGRVRTVFCSAEPVDVVVHVPRGGTTVAVHAGVLAPNDIEHEIVARYAGITLHLRDRAAPDKTLHDIDANYSARRDGREFHGPRRVERGLLLIQPPDAKGTWHVEVEVKGFAPASVQVGVDVDGSAPPVELWLAKA